MTSRVVAPTGVEPVSIASYPLLLLQPPFGVCGLDFLITVAQMRVRLHPSSLYTFQARRTRLAWLGIAMLRYGQCCR